MPFARPKASECNLANRKQIFKISPDINRISGCVSKKKSTKKTDSNFFRGVGIDAQRHRSDVSNDRRDADSCTLTFDVCAWQKKSFVFTERSIFFYHEKRERERERTAGAAGFSVSATSPSALTIKDRLLEDLTCARVAVADKTALFAMVDAKDIVIMRLF